MSCLVAAPVYTREPDRALLNPGVWGTGRWLNACPCRCAVMDSAVVTADASSLFSESNVPFSPSVTGSAPF